MKRGWLQCVRVALTRVFDQPASVYFDTVRKKSRAQVYLTEGARATRGQLAELRACLAEIRTWGVEMGRGRITSSRVRKEDWAESWKKHFPPMEVGPALLIKPSWSKRKPKGGQQVVTLDPGLSFGTGQHATTSFCLRELVRCRRAAEWQSFLDIGTGSGILAIAAAKLGYAPVEAFDFDPDAVRVAAENARVNHVARKLTLARRDVTRLPVTSSRRFQVVCANLIADLLVKESRRIIARVAPGGVLVLAGILAEEFDGVRRHYERAELRLLRTRREKEWRSGSFSHRASAVLGSRI
ncbi:MAG: 50S ribosomal protein L11 methyltransferase [Verrucomicrobia bacterium]|nr:50S ribosomal protein L11 methyltransferase [Verrucomicrobiota bacterium]